MPIYEYACQKCNANFELLIRGNEAATCPACGASQVERQLSVVAAHSSSGDLPVCEPNPGTCGRPQCGMGGCQMM
ncbi:MAG: zinc ribbon domain-containing protein [Pirellulaceae bacterium]